MAKSVLLERDSELEAFERALERVTDGIGSMVLVEGPAGIGKTALLQRAAELARERDLLVRSARGGQLEREMPFGIARQLFESVIERASEEERARLLTGSAELALTALGRSDPENATPTGDPFAPIHGLYWLVANLAEERPLALVVDDAHWADVQTLRWLEYLARRLDDVAVFVVAGVRSGEPDEPAELAPLRLEADAIHPASLSAVAVDELTRAELSQPTPEFSAACMRATAGNPFLLTEVLRTLRTDGIEPGAAAADSIATLGPESVARYVLIRLGRFGDEAISLARAMAVLGAAPQLRHAAALSGLEETGARLLCDQLREAAIIAPGLPIEFVHPLVRSAIYGDHPEEERSAAHRQAAQLLSGSGAGSAQVASHLMACAPNRDQWVVGQLGAAAWDAIRTGAYESAEAYLERALAEPPDDDLPFLYGMGRCKIQSDLAHAPEVLRDVVERATDERMRVGALRWGAVACFVAGDLGGAAHLYEAVLQEMPEGDDERRLVLESQLYCVKAAGAGRDRASSERIRGVVAGTDASTRAGSLARQALAFDLFMDCAPVGEVTDLAASFPPPSHAANMIEIVIGFASKVLAWSGRWEDARRVLAPWEPARERGALIAVSYRSGFLAEIERLAGRLGDSEIEARKAWEIAREISPDSHFGRAASASLLATLIAAGEIGEAERLAQGIDLAGGIGQAVTPWPLEVRGYLRLAQGAVEQGVGDLLSFGEEAERLRYLNPGCAAWRQEAAPALATLDRTLEGEKLIAEGEARARKFGAPHLIGTMLRARGLLEPRKRQIETLRESVALLERAGPPHELARSLVELGAALRRDGQRSDSREPLRQALELATRCGAGGTEARARDELAAGGSRPRSAFRSGVASLTASELRTAKLAAEGLSNVEIAQRLFVTRKTVEKHLSNAYMKLDIGGRDELADALEPPTA